jgi:hypothetical protein
MAKKKKVLPKKVAGFKVPKPLRRSRMLRSLLSSAVGREIAANALTAGAGAAATVLMREREAVADATAAGARKGARKGARAFGIVAEAVEAAAAAMMDVVTDAARSVVPEAKSGKKAKAAVAPKRASKAGGGASTRH